MDNAVLWSLRLGYTPRQAAAIKKLGLAAFLEESFMPQPAVDLPDFLSETPKTQEIRRSQLLAAKALGDDCLKEYNQLQKKNFQDLKSWWILRIMNENHPLREKMTVFWHNHFVASAQKTKMLYWLFEHHNLLRENAFGNFRDLTKRMLKSNALLHYLDAPNNRKGKLNENLSRELLELFTLGPGNYSEEDIKNGAKGLAGLTTGSPSGHYTAKNEDNDEITYFGKTGKFKADEMVDIIFEQPEMPYLLTRKILQWFITDLPEDKEVRRYGDYFRNQHFEIAPLLVKIFTDEAAKKTAATKIKDPLLYMLQLTDALNIKNPNPDKISNFMTSQGMPLFTQPNVKGWSGGRDWLTVYTFSQRKSAASWLCKGFGINGAKENTANAATPDWNRSGDNIQIINEFKQLLFSCNTETLQDDFENLLKYDFDPNVENAENAVIRLFSFMVQTPEFQLI